MHALCIHLHHALYNVFHPHTVKKDLHGKKRYSCNTARCRCFRCSVRLCSVPNLYRHSRACSVATARMMSRRSTGHHLTCGPRWQGQHCCHRTGFRAMALGQNCLGWLQLQTLLPFSLLFSALSLLFCNASSAHRRTCSTALGELNCFHRRNRYCKLIQLVRKAYAFCSQMR